MFGLDRQTQIAHKHKPVNTLLLLQGFGPIGHQKLRENTQTAAWLQPRACVCVCHCVAMFNVGRGGGQYRKGGVVFGRHGTDVDIEDF